MLCFLKSIFVFTSACLLVLHFKHLCSSRSALNSSQFTDIGVLKMFLPQAVLLVNPDPLLFRCIWYDISHLLVETQLLCPCVKFYRETFMKC